MEPNEITELGVLNTYMSELSEVELLSVEEERELFEVMYKWTKNKNCSKKVEKSGKDARNKLIVSNLRLVVRIAKDFRNVGLDYADLISEGNLGLVSAIDKYDLEKGAKLSYYASFWIKQSIRRAISNKGRTIRLPVGLVDLKLKIQRYAQQFEADRGTRPPPEQIAKDLNVPLKKVIKLININLQCDSINSKVSEDETELMDLLKDEKSGSPLLDCKNTDERRLLDNFLNSLDHRQRYIIIRRFGLDGAKPETLEMIGKKFNLTRERIRQLELTGLRSLKEMYKKINKNSFME